MEPAQATLERLVYSTISVVKEIKWMNNPDGHFVWFEGSRESINFGIDHPTWAVGDKVKITFEKVQS